MQLRNSGKMPGILFLQSFRLTPAAMPSFASHYVDLHTDELLDIARKDLLDEARVALNAELQKRGVSLEQATQTRMEGVAERRVAQEQSARLGSRFIRLLAFTIDLWGALLVLLIVLLPLRAFSVDVYVYVALLPWLLYVLLRDSIPGQSVGKRLLGLRVIERETGLSCTWQKSLARNLTHLFFYIDALFILGERKLRLGDRVANTLVVKARVQ